MPALDNFRRKYPQYSDMDDTTLAAKLANKYPQYSDLLTKTEPKQPFLQRTGQNLQKFTQNIPTKLREISKGAPAALQIAGGIGGAALFPTTPIRASAVGGTLGRVAGEQFKQEAQIQPVRAFARQALTPTGLGALAGPPPVQKPEQLQETVEMGKKAVITEAALAPVGFLGGRAFKFLGKGAMTAFQGPRVVERAAERGWRNLLKPEFYKGRVPKFVAEGLDKFFDRLTKTTGRQINFLVKSPKLAGIRVSISDIKNKVRGLLPSGISIEDFGADVSLAQKKLLIEQTRKILAMGGKPRSLSSIWETRKSLDKLLFSKRWGQEATRYLQDMRRILNEPLKSQPQIAKAFGKFSFVKQAEDELGKNFEAVLRVDTGESFALKGERFLGNILSTTKDDTIRILKELDSLLLGSDKIIDSALDFAASEIIEKGPAVGIGFFQRMITGMLGGRKTLARIGAFAGATPTKAIASGIGRAIPTAVTGAE